MVTNVPFGKRGHREVTRLITQLGRGEPGFEPGAHGGVHGCLPTADGREAGEGGR